MLADHPSKVEKAISALIADFTRQSGQLFLSDVIRQIDRKGLSDEEALLVYQKLSDAGISAIAQETAGTSSIAVDGQEASSDFTDLLGLYFEDIFSERLLRADEELSLIRQIRAGETAVARLVGVSATNGQTEILRQLADAGKTARDRMLLANARLAFSIAKSFQGKSQLELFDLIQEGLIGVNRAINTFDPDRGYKFSTYATHWIQQHIRRAFDDKGSTIRIPIHAIELLRKARRVRKALQHESGGAEPSLRDVAQYMGIKPEKLESLELISGSPRSIDLPHPSSEEDDDTLAHYIEANQQSTPEEELFRKEIVNVIFGTSDLLPERQKAILKLRFGLEGENELTLEEIGNRFNLTRERIRQIESKALKRLKFLFTKKSAFYMGRRSNKPKNSQFTKREEKRWILKKPQRNSSTG
jgi:RNA polymerase primary sigma factor